MSNTEELLDIFLFWDACGLAKAPEPEQVRAWHRVLRDVPDGLAQTAAEHWAQVPYEDKTGRMVGRRFCPSAPELRALAFSLEATERAEVRDSRRGCARCGEVVDSDGGIQSHGSGYRTLIQHSHPLDEDGYPMWDAVPYRIGQRMILCGCEKGKWVAHSQQHIDRDLLPNHVKDSWHPTMTIEQAHQRFSRSDSRLYVTGSDDRLHAHDRRSGSPFFCRPSPEELAGKTEAAAAERALVYQVMRGEVDPVAHVRKRMKQMTLRGRSPIRS